jgi:hypothetical protein
MGLVIPCKKTYLNLLTKGQLEAQLLLACIKKLVSLHSNVVCLVLSVFTMYVCVCMSSMVYVQYSEALVRNLLSLLSLCASARLEKYSFI